MNANRQILVVEDDLDYVAVIRAGLELLAPGIRVSAVHDGYEGVRYICGFDGFADRQQFPLPSLILTDLHMPVIDGFIFLQWVKTHPLHYRIPVVVHTSSELPEHRTRAVSLGADGFILKGSVQQLVVGIQPFLAHI